MRARSNLPRLKSFARIFVRHLHLDAGKLVAEDVQSLGKPDDIADVVGFLA
jgi:hypothetical protein